MFLTPNNRKRSAALVGGLMLFLSACGASDAAQEDAATSGEVASLSNNSVTSTTAGASDVEAPTNPDDAFALFEKCMADAGIEMQVFGDGGNDNEITVDGGDASDSTDPQAGGSNADNADPEAFNEANKTCSKHLEGIDNGFELSPEQEVAYEEADREFRACMKEEGVEVPEVDGGGLISIGESAGGADPQSDDPSFNDSDFNFEEFEAAAGKCNSAYDELDAEIKGEDS